MSPLLRLTKWLMPTAALFALACALFSPAEAGSTRQRRSRSQNANVQPQEKPTPPANSTVRGRAVYDDTSRPVRRARVILINPVGGRREYAALTDARGDFHIEGVSAGSYFAYVDMPGMLSPVGFVNLGGARTVPGLPDFGEGRRFFDLVEVDGRAAVTVTVHARRGAAIAGRVSYADGDPAINAVINLMHRDADGRVEKHLTGSSVNALAGVRTDDRGMFRLVGLAPGEYLIGVTELVSHGTDNVDEVAMGEAPYTVVRSIFTQHLLMTFYPSVTEMKKAAVIKVEAGEERTDIDITIPERELRTVSGVVRARRGGLPVSGARVSITRRDDPLATNGPMAAYLEFSESGLNSTLTDERGRWQLVEIPDGDYTLNVRPPGGDEEDEEVVALYEETSAADAAPASKPAAVNRSAQNMRLYAPTRVNLEVSGGDVSEFVVEVAEGARVTGTVSVEGGGQPSYWHVSLVRVGEDEAALKDVGASAAGAGNGRFTMEGLPAGRFLIHSTIVGGEEDDASYLKSITWNGKDLLREPLALTEGAEAAGVHIVYGRNRATLRVTVRGAAGRQPAAGVFVAVVPADLSMWSANVQPLLCQPTGGGKCEISMPPGEYRVLTFKSLTLSDSYAQEVRRRAPTAPRVTLREGETVRVEVDAPGDN